MSEVILTDSRPIFLSPHYDDIAFSLGGLIAASPRGLLVDLFTRSSYIAGGGSSGPPTAEEIERISSLRRAEEERYAAMRGLTRTDFGLDEPRQRGRKSRDASGVADDIGQLASPLGTWLEAELADGAPRLLFCPAAIGGHVNHMATRDVVIALLPKLQPQVRVFFYEDLPYARSPFVRRKGIAALRAALAGLTMRRLAWKVDDRAEKLRGINSYPSQHRRVPSGLRRFSPGTIWPLGAHEAVWEVNPPA